MKKLMLAAAAALAMGASGAQAAVIFSTGSVAGLTAVHSDGTQGPLASVLGTLVTPGDVTFTSGHTLSTNGNGVAQIQGPWTSITYGMTDHTGIVETNFSVDQSGNCRDCTVFFDALIVGGGHVTGSLAYAGHDSKFNAVADGGDLIDTLTITVKSGSDLHAVDSLRQVEIGLATVPEPATWAMMILGFGAIGGAMRRRSLAGQASA